MRKIGEAQMHAPAGGLVSLRLRAENDELRAEVERLQRAVTDTAVIAQERYAEIERLRAALSKWAPLCSCGCYACCELSDLAMSWAPGTTAGTSPSPGDGK